MRANTCKALLPCRANDAAMPGRGCFPCVGDPPDEAVDNLDMLVGVRDRDRGIKPPTAPLLVRDRANPLSATGLSSDNTSKLDLKLGEPGRGEADTDVALDGMLDGRSELKIEAEPESAAPRTDVDAVRAD